MPVSLITEEQKNKLDVFYDNIVRVYKITAMSKSDYDCLLYISDQWQFIDQAEGYVDIDNEQPSTLTI